MNKTAAISLNLYPNPTSQIGLLAPIRYFQFIQSRISLRILTLAKSIFCYALPLLTALSATAQIFAPFNESTTALYTTFPEKGATSYLAFSEMENQGDTLVFKTFKTFDSNDFNDVVIVENCFFWSSGDYCFTLNIAPWLGAEMRLKSFGKYDYITSFEDTLNLNFNIAPGDSSLVFEDDSQVLYLIYELSETAEYLNFTDSVARYRLAHLDNTGGMLESALHDSPIVIGKELGMINFFRIDSFPFLLEPIQLMGDRTTEAGLHVLKATDIYDFNEGDFFQRKFISNYPNPDSDFVEFKNTTILSREETDQALIYSVQDELMHFFRIGFI